MAVLISCQCLVVAHRPKSIKGLLTFAVAMAKYKRPVPPATSKVPEQSVIGAQAISWLNGWLTKGLRLDGGTDRLVRPA